MRVFAAAPILVTGATGNTGWAVARALQARGLPVRVAGTSPQRLAALFPGVAQVRLDYRDPSTFGPATRGCRALFLVRPPAVSRLAPTLAALVDAARVEGVGQVVFLSVAGAGESALVPHHAVERHLMAGRGGWTVLRPGFFAQNLATAYRRDLLLHDRLLVPAGRGRVAFVDTRDVAEVAATALASPARHAGKAYTLTGPEALSFQEVADLLGEALRRPIRYRSATMPGYAAHLLAQGMPLADVLGQVGLHLGLRSGKAARLALNLGLLLGRAPRTLRSFVRENLDQWRR